MTKEELLKRLEQMALVSGSDGNPGDPEVAHMEADSFLLEYIADEDVSAAFNKIIKSYI
jgi:hypothetical protein